MSNETRSEFASLVPSSLSIGNLGSSWEKDIIILSSDEEDYADDNVGVSEFTDKSTRSSDSAAASSSSSTSNGKLRISLKKKDKKKSSQSFHTARAHSPSSSATLSSSSSSNPRLVGRRQQREYEDMVTQYLQAENQPSSGSSSSSRRSDQNQAAASKRALIARAAMSRPPSSSSSRFQNPRLQELRKNTAAGKRVPGAALRRGVGKFIRPASLVSSAPAPTGTLRLPASSVVSNALRHVRTPTSSAPRGTIFQSNFNARSREASRSSARQLEREAEHREKYSVESFMKSVLEWPPHRLLGGVSEQLKRELSTIPTRFHDVESYIQSFYPLVKEELRAAVEGDLVQIAEAVGPLISSGRPAMSPEDRFNHLQTALQQEDTFSILSLSNFAQTSKFFTFHASQHRSTSSLPLRKNDLLLLFLRPSKKSQADGGGRGRKFEGDSVTSSLFGSVASPVFAHVTKIEKSKQSNRHTGLVEVHVAKPTDNRSDGQLRLKLSSSSYSWCCIRVQNMTPALRELSSLVSVRKMKLLPYFLDPLKKNVLSNPKCAEQVPTSVTSGLNPSQAEAVSGCVGIKEGVALVQGPPGTGKTRFIVALIQSLVIARPKSRILVCAPSNAATDEVARRLQEVLADKCVRFSHKAPGKERSRLDRELSSMDFSRKVREDPNMVELRSKLQSLRNELDILLAKNEELERQRRLEVEKRSAADGVRLEKLQSELRNISLQIPKVKQNLRSHQKLSDKNHDAASSSVWKQAQVVVCTLSGSGSPQLEGVVGGFDTVVADEAAQAVEVSTLIPLQQGCRRLVLVGDTNQLQATVLSMNAARFDYDKSFFHRALVAAETAQASGKSGKVTTFFLDTQYRMHSEISRFPSSYFYGGRIKNGLKDRDLPWYQDTRLGPYTMFDIRSGRQSSRGCSFVNEEEAEFVVQYCELLMSVVRGDRSLRTPAIGVVTPYKSQSVLLRRKLTRSRVDVVRDIEVNTVDGFQGREMDVIVLSCVRAGSSSVGFLRHRERLNVALTRARQAMVVVGHLQTLQSDTMWHELIKDAQERRLVIAVDRGTQILSPDQFDKFKRSSRPAAVTEMARSPRHVSNRSNHHRVSTPPTSLPASREKPSKRKELEEGEVEVSSSLSRRPESIKKRKQKKSSLEQAVSPIVSSVSRPAVSSVSVSPSSVRKRKHSREAASSSNRNVSASPTPTRKRKIPKVIDVEEERSERREQATATQSSSVSSSAPVIVASRASGKIKGSGLFIPNRRRKSTPASVPSRTQTPSHPATRSRPTEQSTTSVAPPMASVSSSKPVASKPTLSSAATPVNRVGRRQSPPRRSSNTDRSQAYSNDTVASRQVNHDSRGASDRRGDMVRERSSSRRSAPVEPDRHHRDSRDSNRQYVSYGNPSSNREYRRSGPPPSSDYQSHVVSRHPDRSYSPRPHDPYHRQAGRNPPPHRAAPARYRDNRRHPRPYNPHRTTNQEELQSRYSSSSSLPSDRRARDRDDRRRY